MSDTGLTDDHWKALQAEAQRKKIYAQRASAKQAQNIAAQYNATPAAQPGVIVAAGTAAAQDPANAANLRAAVQTAVTIAPRSAQQKATSDAPTYNQYLAENPQVKPGSQDKGGGFSWTSPADLVGAAKDTMMGTTRAGLAVAQGGVESIQTLASAPIQAASRAFTDVQEGNLTGALLEGATYAGKGNPLTSWEADQKVRETTTAWQAAKQIMAGDKVDLGEGFFPSTEGSTGQLQADAARRIRGTIGGKAWTIGRFGASLVTEPGSSQYNLLSGLGDAAVTWYLDPIPQMSHAYGAIKAERATISVDKAAEFLDSSAGQRLIYRLADESSHSKIAKGFGYQVSPETVEALARADNPLAVSGILMEKLGIERGLMSTSNMKGLTKGSPFALGVKRVVTRLPGGETAAQFAARQVESIPKTELVFGRAASERDLTESFSTMDRYLTMMKFPEARKVALLDEWGAALAENYSGGIYGAYEHIANVMKETLIQHGVPELHATRLTRFAGDTEAIAGYGRMAMAHQTDFNFAATIARNGGAGGGQLGMFDLTDLSHTGPSFLSEGLGGRIKLPDVRDIRRLTSNRAVRFLTTNTKLVEDAEGVMQAGKNFGKMNLPTSVADFVSTELWKPFRLLQPASTLRVIGEEQGRMAASGIPSLYSHPLEHMAMVADPGSWTERLLAKVGVKAKGNYLADGSSLINDIDRAGSEYGKTLQRSFNAFLDDPLEAQKAAVRTGTWSKAEKGIGNPIDYEQGMAHQVRLAAHDPFAARVAAGQSNEEIFAWFKGSSAEAKATRAEMGFKTKYGETAVDGAGNPVRVFHDYTDPAVFNAHLDARIRPRLQNLVGDNPELRQIVAAGTAGHVEEVVNNADLRVIKAGPEYYDDFDGAKAPGIRPGSEVAHPEHGRVTVINAGNEDGTSIISRPGFAWDGRNPTDETKRVIRDWMAHPDSPKSVPYQVITTNHPPEWASSALKSMQTQKDAGVRWMFAQLWTKPTDYLSRNPAFKHYYWNQVADLAETLHPSEINKLMKTIEAGGGAASLPRGVADRILEAAKSGSKGASTVEDLDAFAKGHALDSVRGLLYDASEKSNLLDTARIISPFAEAMREIMTRWVGIVGKNPGVIRRAQVVVQGARDSGFFHTDANGDEVFSIPLSGPVIQMLTGVNADFTSKVSGLNIAGNLYPSLGPVVSMPLSQIIPETPQFDAINSALFPYGRTGSWTDQILPSWQAKIVSGIIDDPTTAGTYASTYVNVLQGNISSGKYASTPEGQQALIEDSKIQARHLTVLRGVAQAVLPSAPAPEYMMQTKEGDMPVAVMSNLYRALQADDYDTADAKFLAMYGELASTYMTGKTKAMIQGLDESSDFGDWERNNAGVMGKYKEVGAFFAPIGSDFDFDVYNRQLATGQRRKLTDQEMLDSANSVIAYTKLRMVKDAIGPKPTEEQAAWLRDTLKPALAAQYPGYTPNAAFDPKKFDRSVEKLTEASNDKRLADNPVAGAMRTYVQYRDAALAEAENRGFHSLHSDDVADLRQYLANVGQALSKQTPDFARLYERLLSNEVDV